MSENKPMRIRPSGKKSGGCGGCGKRIKRTDKAGKNNPQRTIRKRF
jgi:hypothetical protein